MPEIHHHQQQQQQQQPQQQLLFHQSRPATNSKLGGMKGGLGGEIVEVQGGHIVRSTGRKDRHCKVCTAKGPRDRRVRLSAHTAIQFYDVQDRLGYDRPSKAVDWLIKNAKAAIDDLAELPPWHPTATSGAISDPYPEMHDSGKKVPPVHMGESAASSSFSFGGSSSFLPPSLESDAIADTIKFFFPVASSGGGGGSSSITAATAASSSTFTGFHQYPHDLLSLSNSHVQDLRLSLQSFQDPILHHHHQQHPPQQQSAVTEQSLFGNYPPTWSEQNQRLLHWGSGNETGGESTTTTIVSDGGASSASYLFNQMSEPQSVPLPLHPVLGQSPFLTQGGPLQSNNSPSILASTDPAAAAVMSGGLSGFASGSFSEFRIPARIQGEEERDDGIGISRKPSSAPRR